MSTVAAEPILPEATARQPRVPEPIAEPFKWGNSAPLALAAFAVTTFMLSMVNANAIDKGVQPVVFGVALMFGGLTQLIAGIIQFRNQNTFTGMLFGAFGAFWLSLFAIVQFFAKEIPAAQVGHALGLFLYSFGIFTFVMWIASFRTSVVTVLALFVLMLTFFLLGAGNYGAHTTLIHWGGYLGIVTAALAGYLACAEVCEASYGRSVLPVWPLAKR
ncbi:MAG TPA: acetate uptake transporter [Solirubrobacteraceae bacterium]|nr:acetate uptake transporter [Solirubrobacteraceae bacterium]